jgi:hypothetical protein
MRRQLRVGGFLTSRCSGRSVLSRPVLGTACARPARRLTPGGGDTKGRTGTGRMAARFIARRDPWLVALCLASAIGAVGAAAALIVSKAGPVTKVVFATLCFGAALFIGSCLARTYYELSDGKLEVRHGPLRWSIPYSAIESVAPEHSYRSSAALSAERFSVNYGPGRSTIEISPSDRSGFLSALAATSTCLEPKGNALVRRTN